MAGNGNGNGNGNGKRRNRRVIPGVTTEVLLAFFAKRVYSAALAMGRSAETVPALAVLAPLAEAGVNLSIDQQLEIGSTINTLRILFNLDEQAVELLLLTLAYELDERIYVATLHVTAGVPGSAGPRVGGLLSLLYPDSTARGLAHQALLEDSPLVRYRLVRLLGPKNTPLSQCELCAEPSLLQHILLDGTPSFPPVPATLAGVGKVFGPADADAMDGELPVELGHQLDLLLTDPGTIRGLHLRLQTTRIADSIARRMAAHIKRPIVVLDLRAVDEGHEVKVVTALREARLRNGLPFFANPMSIDVDEEKGSTMRRNAQHWRRMLAFETSLVILASEGKEGADVDRLPSVGLDISSYDFPRLGIHRRKELFGLATQRLANEQPGGIPQIAVSPDVSTDHLASVYRVTEAEINAIVSGAAAQARLRCLVEGAEPTVTMQDIQRAARDKTHRDVGRFARLVSSTYRWNDLVLPHDVKNQIADIYISAKKRMYVNEDWGYSDKHARGLSLAVVFSGSSGTGKTMTAEVLANELGVNLYQVDLSSVVSKWIGETERHLQEIFDATENSDSILFFDEADALFGKRTQVNEAKDRYANIEVSYLLQRMESYSGIVILSTNLRSNIDDAFLRRLQYGLVFPMPDEEARIKIWRGSFPPSAPFAGVQFDKLAAKWSNLSGGQIRLIALGAAMLAAGEESAISTIHIERAYAHEQTKMMRVTWVGQEELQ